MLLLRLHQRRKKKLRRKRRRSNYRHTERSAAKSRDPASKSKGNSPGFFDVVSLLFTALRMTAALTQWNRQMRQSGSSRASEIQAPRTPARGTTTELLMFN